MRESPRLLADPFDAGPFTRLQAALHLPPPCATRAAWRRAAGAAALAWLPPILLCALQPSGRTALGSFFADISTHVQYLIALPALLLAEPWCLTRLASLKAHFASGGVVDPADVAEVERLAERARGALDHRAAEVGLVLLAYGWTLLSVALPSRDVPTWMVPGPGHVSAAGWWRLAVSHPLLLLLIVTWVWRLLVWASFLRGVARLRLNVIPSHPDLAGGLGFLTISLRAFTPVALAFNVVVAGAVADIVRAGASMPIAHLAAAGAATALLFSAPLLTFTGPIHLARLHGMLTYGGLARALGRRFEDRWLAADATVDPDALGAPDFSATTDLYSITANVWRMRLLPVTLRDVVVLILAALLPFLPLVLLTVSAAELLRGAASLLL